MNVDVIPSFGCRLGCADCCGLVVWTYREHQALRAYLKERERKEAKPNPAEPLTCPYVESGQCSVYEVRPLLCRLYGTVAGMQCPHGCRPACLLDAATEEALMLEYIAEIDRGAPVLQKGCH